MVPAHVGCVVRDSIWCDHAAIGEALFDLSYHGGDGAGCALKVIERCAGRDGEKELVVFAVCECTSPCIGLRAQVCVNGETRGVDRDRDV